MGNLRQSMTEEEWNELGKQSKENKQPSMKYTIDTQNKTKTQKGNKTEKAGGREKAPFPE